MQRIFIKKYFLFLVGSVCREKQFKTRLRKTFTYDAQPSVEVAEITVKRLLCCWFQCTGKAIGQVYE
jgi:hypothetical protein